MLFPALLLPFPFAFSAVAGRVVIDFRTFLGILNLGCTIRVTRSGRTITRRDYDDDIVINFFKAVGVVGCGWGVAGGDAGVGLVVGALGVGVVGLAVGVVGCGRCVTGGDAGVGLVVGVVVGVIGLAVGVVRCGRCVTGRY